MSCLTTLMRCACFLICLLLCGAAAAAPRQIIVAQDGSGQFTSINGAMASVTDAAKDSPVDIVIEPGTYAETITTRDWINLVGRDRETCIIRYDGAPDNIEREHTIWATSHTAIKNLTLIGLTVKYVIHSDGGTAYILTIENCTLRREYPSARARRYPTAFGIGLHANQHILMKNCLVEADLGILWHNWNAQKAPCSMTLERCALKGKEHAIKIRNLGSGQTDYFVLHDCVLESEGPAVKYMNQRNVAGVTWSGRSETVLRGSGNTMGKVTGAAMQDDSGERQSGLQLARTVEERYGTGPGRVHKPGFFRPAPKTKKHYLKMEATENALVFTCPGPPESQALFGTAAGPKGAQIAMPVSLTVRMKLTPAANGQTRLYYCMAPNAWAGVWAHDRVLDLNNPAAAIKVDATSWQTYRLVARSPDDVRLYVEGAPGDGIRLTPSRHTAAYFQFRVYGHGTKAEIESAKLVSLQDR